ncbi:MAG TPA: hypothetical protein VKX17_17945 [Planctomycetota bacterium]|nr:hypothetical protein [Planctomycetota bacterium]
MSFILLIERKAREKGLREGMREGLKEGLKEGLNKGILQTNRANIVELLRARFGRVPLAMGKAVRSIDDPIVLKSIFRNAVKCESLDEFKRVLSR